MRFSLRTLLILMLLGGPLCALGWRGCQNLKARMELDAQRDKYLTELQLFYERSGQLPPSPDNDAYLRNQFDDVSTQSLKEIRDQTIGPQPPPPGRPKP